MGIKKLVLKFRSVNSIVIPPAKTGSDNNKRTAVIRTAQANKGKIYMFIPRARMLNIVTMKLIAPRIDEAPAICKLKMVRSTAGPECA